MKRSRLHREKTSTSLSRITEKMLRSLHPWTWIAIFLLTRSCHAASSRSSTTSRSEFGDEGFPLSGMTADRFVSAAPLIMAAVCSDGVAIVATHTAFASEPLLLDDDLNDDSDDVTTNVDSQNPDKASQGPKDLPKSYRGPFRINQIDGFGTCLVCTGWRADTQVLADYCRSLASSEVAVFGEPKLDTSYGQYLASEASLWMAQRAVSERVRALSCVGLLACCGKENSTGYLWLVDATGFFRIRAHAIGGGTMGAASVNGQLAEVDFSKLSKEEAVKRMLQILVEDKVLELPAEARVEIAVASVSPVRRMERLLSSSLFEVDRNVLKE